MIKDFVVNEVVNCTMAVVEAQIKDASNGNLDEVNFIIGSLYTYRKVIDILKNK